MLIIEVPKNQSFKNSETREALARYVANVLMAHESPHPRSTEVPYNQTVGDDRKWVLDHNNDWWLFFDLDNEQRVRIQHRYDNPAAGDLMRWVAYRFFHNAKVIEA